MPYIEPNTIDVIPKKHRAKLKTAMDERAVLGYSFSWSKLIAMMETNADNANHDEAVALLQGCVVAYNDEQAKEAKAEVNETIASELKLAGVKTVRDTDPFGRPKDYMVMEGNSSSFSKQVAMDILVADYDISAKAIAEVWKRATTATPYVTVQARDVSPAKIKE